IKATHAARQRPGRGGPAGPPGEDHKPEGEKPIPPDASTTMPIEAQRKLPDVVLVNRDGPLTPTPQYPLAVDKVRHVGEAVVLVVAETLPVAQDAAEEG